MKKISPVVFLFLGLLITVFFTFIPLICDPFIEKIVPKQNLEENPIVYASSEELAFEIFGGGDYGENGILKEKAIKTAIKITWFVFIPFFLFPLSVMVPLHWYERRKVRKIAAGALRRKKISLIFTGYNKKEFMRKMIDEKIKENKNADLEIVVEDSHFPEKSFEEIKKYGLDYPESINVYRPKGLDKLKIFNNENGLIILNEYTSGWGRMSPKKWRIKKAETDLEKDLSNGVNGIMLNLADYNEKTKKFVENALEKREIKFLRADGSEIGYSGFILEEILKIANKNKRTVFLSEMPEYPAKPGRPVFRVEKETSWLIFPPSLNFSTAIPIKFEWYGKNESPLPKVSLIFPAYNEEKLIGKTIERAITQDYNGELEIVIIDDGSTDATYEIAKKYGEENSNVKIYRHERNKGKPEALNTGFAKATGEISIFSDSDSHLDSDLVSRMIPHFNNPKIGMVSGMVVIDNEVNNLTKLQQIEYLYNQEIVRFCQNVHQGVLICPGAATAIRTQIGRDIPSTERTVTEDSDFTFEVAKAGWMITQEPEAISRTEAPENWKELIEQRKRWLYGVLQTIAIHKWALFFKGTKTPNLWVWWAWAGYLICPITTFAIIAIPLFTYLVGLSYLIFLGFYSLLIGIIFGLSHWYGLKEYRRENKTKLSFLLPFYMVYQYILNLLLFFLVAAFITGKGVKVRYGGRIIHAV